MVNTETSSSDLIKQTILRYLINTTPQMIPIIANETGYSVPTVSKYVSELVTDGMLLNHGKTKGLRGRQPNFYGVNPTARYYVGVDIKTFGYTIGIMNLVGEIVKLNEYHSHIIENTPYALEEICSTIKKDINSLGAEKHKVKMVAVNLSGRVDTKTGYCYSIFNFEGNDEPLSKILSEKIGVSTVIENDTRSMTYGELVSGNGSKYRNFLYVNASWGIGLGIVIDGKLYYGNNGYTGEIGHMNTYSNEVMCHCGKKGCFETEVSGRAIHRKLIERINNGEVSTLSNAVQRGEHIHIGDIIKAASGDDTLSIELLEYVGTELGRLIASLINIFNPEAVIIGGRLTEAGDYFLSPITQAIRKYSLRLVSKDVAISFSTLKERSGIIGACLIARQRDIEG